jgi:hypothetical protein
MPNPRNQAAHDGWLLFREADPPPTREAINEALAARDLPPISLRTYDHYGRLIRHGYDRYVPINELDMAVKLGRLRQAS